ncbi:MAG: Flp pilus assembly complex ATPase component TadA [Thaumarchaeota archaeon]|nr:Flp pilus assembly complex ATPase component TadA [Nitrososphaerota archaeon]
MEKIIPDTSIIIDGKITELVKDRKDKDVELVIPRAVLDELQAQASKSREPGFIGLRELKKIREACEEAGIKFRIQGDRPSLDDIRLARSGRIDAIIRDVAKNDGGVLYTADFVQALVAEAEGVKVRYLPPQFRVVERPNFEQFFTPETLSVHLKEGVAPLAKKGKPGDFKLVKIRDERCTGDELEGIIAEISEEASRGRGTVEISRSGATVFQLGSYRIAVSRAPFSDAMEVTIVRPIVKLSLEDYNLSDSLKDLLKSKAEGVVIAGPPGSGKTTLASSLAEFYTEQGKIVKTFESPRDLQVGPEVTQYGPLEGDFEKTAEILLLVRPDYTVYDEVRRTKDFEVFCDMRLAGVGMVGVVHASNPVDAVQRFMGRVELGMIPSIIDTVIFVKGGEIKKVLRLNLVVKVPTGMIEADLARPVVEVRDFETASLEYEIYTFGEENVIIPVKSVSRQADAVQRLAEERVTQYFRKFDPNATVEIIAPNRAKVKVDRSTIPRIIGKGGGMISEIEDTLGIRIDVEPKVSAMGEEMPFDMKEAGNSVELVFRGDMEGKTVSVYVANTFLFAATVGRKRAIKVSKKSDVGARLIRALMSGEEIKAILPA